MKIGAIYVRKSIQTLKGESIQNQINMCISYAKDNDILTDNTLIYCDEGYSGKDFKRPQFKQMLNDLKNKKFNTIMSYRLDRISRSLKDFSNLIQTLDSSDCSFVSIKEQFDTSTPLGKSMMYIASVFSELERETIAERVKDNVYSLAKSGRWLGGITPTGFKSTLIPLKNGDLTSKETYILSPINDEIKIVMHLFDQYLKFKSLSKLEDYCTDNNIRSKNSILFTQTTLKQILVNPVYCVADQFFYNHISKQNFSISNNQNEFNGEYGVLLYKINEENLISLSSHKGVIPSKDWIYTQDIISKNNKLTPRQGTSSIGLLSGLVYCELCSNLMRVKYGRRTNDSVSYYYLCTIKEKHRNDCNSSNLKGIDTDRIICEQIKELFASKEFFSYFLEYILIDRKSYNTYNTSIMRDKDLKHLDEVKPLNSRLDALKVQLKTQVNSPSHKYIVEQIKSIKYRLSVLNRYFVKQDMSENAIEYSNALDQMIDFYEHIILTFNILVLDFEEKKYLLNEIISSIRWNNFSLYINFN